MKLLHELFPSFYALLKHTIGIPRGNNGVYTRIFLIALTSFVLLLFSFFLAGCGLFLLMLKAYLRWKEGGRFAEMMTSGNSIWSKRFIHILFTVTATNPHAETVRILRPTFQNLYGSCDKFSYLIRSCAGYGYYVRGTLNLDEYITDVQCENRSFWTRDTLLDYVESNLFIPGVCKDRTWRLTTFKQPVRWMDGSNKYAFILTFNHCVGDGIAVMSLLKNKVADNFEILNLYTPVISDTSVAKSLDGAYIYSGGSPLEHTERKFEHLMTIFIENETKYVPIVKKLKKKLNVDFTGILLAASSVAFAEYAIKNNRPLQKLNLLYSLMPISADIVRMVEGHRSYNYNDLGNNSVFADMYLDADTSTNMLKSVMEVRRLREEYINSSNLTLMKIIRMLPPPLELAILLNLAHGVNVSISNVASIVSLRAGGCELGDVFAFVWPVDYTGLLLCVLTYDNKFHISMEAGTDVVESREDLNAIIERAFEHIELLYEELNQNGQSDNI